MRERPILFSAPMVRAILDGRKTQTRRVIKPQPGCLQDIQALQYHAATGEPFVIGKGNPYGQHGDRLWVRETWMDRMTNPNFAEVEYRADYDSSNMPDWKWRPSIFMPRAYSRITLEIVAVRVERLNEISREDAIAEGIQYQVDGWVYDDQGRGYHGVNPRITYRHLWESINGTGSWERNPWVWVVEFRRVEK